MTQLDELAIPFPRAMIRENPSGGGSYVPHAAVVQRLLLHLGAYSFELVELIRGDLTGKAPNPEGQSKRAKDGTPDLHGAVVGAVCRLSCTLDGQRVVIEEVGDCEDPYNWPHDGARAKDAMSDALKRCAMRLGLGLHLWCKTPADYFLRDKLKEHAEEGSADA